MTAAWPALCRHSVQIWFAPLDQLAVHQTQAWHSLSDDEKVRARRFHFEQHRRRFIASRFFLRSLLSIQLGQPAAQIQFVYSERGKPALYDPDGTVNLRFNLAHSSNLAVVGLALDQDLGVDVEHLSPLRMIDQIAARFFSGREQVEFKALPAGDKLAGFYHGWTRKEAFVKALGDGLAYPLADFDVSLTPGQPACLLQVAGNPDEASHWSLFSFQPLPDYLAALAIRKAHIDVDVLAFPVQVS